MNNSEHTRLVAMEMMNPLLRIKAAGRVSSFLFGSKKVL
jgi:hypothetical protein